MPIHIRRKLLHLIPITLAVRAALDFRRISRDQHMVNPVRGRGFVTGRC